MLLLLQQLAGVMQRHQSAAVIVRTQRLQGALGSIQQGLRMGQSAVFCVELNPLVRLRRQLFDFTNLPRQSLAFTL